MSGSLLKAKSITPTQAAQVLMEAVPVADDVLRIDPESKWLYPPEKDVFSSLLPSSWRERPEVELNGQLMCVNRGGEYVMRPFENKSQFTHAASRSMQMMEAASLPERRPANLRKLAEAFVGSRFVESLPDFSTKMASYVPYITGPYDRQQYTADLLLAKSRAYHAWNFNPFGHRIPLIIAYFVVGRGVAALFKDPTAQQFWDRFCEYNGFAMKYQGSGRGRITGNKLTTFNVMLSVDGELMLHFTPAEDTLRVQALDSSTILEIVTDPWDIEKVFYYHQQFMPQYQTYVTSPNIPSVTYTIRQVPPDQVLHVALNTFDNEKRGRSDCMSVYGWMRKAADIANAAATAAYMRSCYVWDIGVTGSPTDVTRVANEVRNNPHRPGMAYIHSDAVTRQSLGPTFSGSGIESDLSGLINLIALGSGVPPAYLMGSFGANRQAVLTETEPSGKFFLDRQGLNEQILHEMKYRLFKWLRDTQGVRVRTDECEFTFPSINMYDRTNFLSALGVMEDRQWFSPERCATLASKEFQVNNYNYQQEFMEVQRALSVKTRLDTQRNVESQQSMMMATGGAPNGNANTDQNAAAGGSEGASGEQGNGKKSAGIKFLGAGKKSTKSSTKAPNESGGVDEAEAARTRKSLA